MDKGQTRLLAVLSALVIAVAAALYFGKDHEPAGDPDATVAVWSIDPLTATGVTVQRESGSLSLEKRGEDWFVAEPADRADPDQVHDLLDSLAQMKLGIPVPNSAGHAADFGLGDPPNARVVLTLPDGDHALDVGVEAPIGFRTYVELADGAIVAVNGDLNRSLQADLGRYRDHHVVRFDAAQVRDVRITGPDGVLHVHGEGLDWFLDGFGRADGDKVDDLVVGLLDLRYDDLSGAADPKLGAVTYDVAITLADGSRVGLQTGEQTPQGVIVAGSDGRQGVVYPEALRQLGRGPTDVALRDVFGIRVDVTDAVKISAGGKSVEARRNGSAWHVDGADDADTFAWVSALAHTQSEIRREPPPDPSPVALTIEASEGDRRWTIQVGPKLAEGDFRSLRDAAADAPVRIPAPAIDEALRALP